MDTPQDITTIKSKLLEQIKTEYTPEQAKKFEEKINGMNDDEFTQFLKLQGLIPGENGETQQCIFCALASGQMPRTEIEENSKSIAILELNPVSLGHTLILPKEHIKSEQELPQEAKNLAEKVKIDLERTFKPQRIDLIPANVMGHQIINILPIYNNETIESEKQSKTPEELAAIKKQIKESTPKIIEEKKEAEIIKEKNTTETINDTNDWIPKKPKP